MKNLYLFLLSTIITLSVDAQTAWQKSYGDTTSDQGQAICKTSSGGYCIVGSTYFHSADSSEVAVYFIDQNGDLVNASTVGLPGNDFPMSVVEAYDGNFIITGYTYSSPLDTGNSDIFAIKVDNVSGFEMWAHFYGGANEDRGYTIITTPDSNYLIGGSTSSFGPFNQSALALKIDDNGDPIWSKITGIGIETEYRSATIASDGNYILCGTAVDGNGSDHYITKMMSDGTVLWTNQLGSTSNETSYCITATADSGFIIAGRYVDPGILSEDQLLTKIDTGGNVQWAKTYSTIRDERLMGVIQNADGNYVSTGYTNTDSLGLVINNLTISEYDRNGNTIWSNIYGTSADISEGYAIIPSIDAGYATTGLTYGTGDPAGEANMIKIDTSGFSSCDQLPWTFTESSPTMTLTNAGFENVITLDSVLSTLNSNGFTTQYAEMCFWDGVKYLSKDNMINLYPNPASSDITIDGTFENSTASIYDRIGSLVKSVSLTANKSFINIDDLTSGIYLVRISGTSSVLKFVKE